MTDDPRVIKRYANRKLYDTDLRQFTTLDDLSGLLDKGIRFVVRDHDSGDDRTDEVLAQVLGRRVRGGGGGTDLLAGLLRAPGQIAQQLVDEATGTSRAAAPVEKPKKKSGGKKAGSKKAGSKKAGSKKAEGAKKATSAETDEIERQQQEIAELRSQISELTAAVSLLVQDRIDAHEASGTPAGDDA